MTPIAYLEPTAESGVPLDPYERQLPSGDSIVVGLLSNSFPDSREFLAELERELGSILPQAAYRRFDKGALVNVSIPLPGDQMVGISKEVQAIVTAWGH